MAKIIDKLWNWGHLEGSHNELCNLDCHMSPEGFAEEYGIPNAFIVSYGGNIRPPYDAVAKRFTSIKQIKWSVLGDASTPLPEDTLGNTKDVVAVAKNAANVNGGVVDDFFSPVRVERFTPDVLAEIKSTLNQNGLDFWCVLYKHELDEKFAPYLACFDGITFWIWECADIVNMEADVARAMAAAKGKKLMLGVYLWDYGTNQAMDTALYRRQLTYYFDLLEQGKIEGIIFCSNTIGDSGLETCSILKEYLAEYGQRNIKA